MVVAQPLTVTELRTRVGVDEEERGAPELWWAKPRCFSFMLLIHGECECAEAPAFEVWDEVHHHVLGPLALALREG